jgi:beta-glucosidase
LIRRASVVVAFAGLAACRPAATDSARAAPTTGAPAPAYLDATKSVDERVDDLVERLTLEEKVQLLHGDTKFTTAAIPRLGIPPRRLSDGPHGVREDLAPHTGMSAGHTDDFATWLPVSVALAATWNPDLARRHGVVLGQEARARGKSIMLGPGVNIQRTPLGGRDFEYLSEDPYLAARMAVPWIRGVQSQQVAACVKHYALNNQEWERSTINVEVDERALREIYLPAFEAAVKEAGVLTVMGAYNQVRGQHACHNDYLLNKILKEEWGFKGVVISDWDGTHSTREAAFNGLDLEMGTERPYQDYYLARPFQDLVRQGVVPMSVVDDKVRRNLRVMFLTKAFDGRAEGAINTAIHQQTARRIAEESMVLLKNDGGLLPLDSARVHSIAVIGENATRKHAHAGGSSEIKPLFEVTPLDGLIARAASGANVVFSRGYTTAGRGDDRTLLERAVAAAKQADVAVIVGGLNHDDLDESEGEGKDRRNLELPGGQAELIARVAEANPRTIVVLVSGAPVTMEPWLAKVPAVLQAWYAGMEGGNALAAILFGDVTPSGKLPLTFPKRLADSPAHALGAYPGKKGTVRYDEGLLVGYRWFDAKAIEPLFPFGHGLSYTSFEYSNLRIAEGGRSRAATPLLTVQVDVANKGGRAGSETVQLYVRDVQSTQPRPPKELKGFSKIALEPGEKRTVEIALGPEAFAFYDPARKGWIAEAGEFQILIGSSSRDVRLSAAYHLSETRAVPR